jgi:hypothetical protein
MRVGSNLARRAPRNADFGELQETFLVAAVATILVIRTQLWLTNYPQLGGHGLHIAHLLYGGMFMVIAIGILLTFVGRSPRRPAAMIGGVGFGFFIGWIFPIWALVSVAWVFEVVLPLGIDLGGALPGFRSDAVSNLAFVNIASLVGSTASAVLVAVGLEQLRRHSRLDAYRMFDRALLVSIFGTRVFAFVESQFGAVFGLAIDLILLIALRSLQAGEHGVDAAAAASRPARPRHAVAS